MKVTILEPTRHDGKRLSVGDVVDVSKAAALALIASGAAEEGGSVKKAQAPDAKAEAIATAEKAVIAATEALVAAGDDEAAKTQAQAALAAAEAQLADLRV
jgi:hypothetical protein